MPHYEFTDQAELDLDDIIEYTLNNWGHSQATKYIEGIDELLQNLAGSPELGITRDNLFDGLLSFPYVSHILYYLKQTHGITVIRILHKRMDAKKHISTV